MQAEIETNHDADRILCECPLDLLQAQVQTLERQYAIEITRQPSACMTMLRAEDSLERQEFFLGEALTTECDVEVNGLPGFGVCLGDEPVRSYCLAVCDALLQNNLDDAALQGFLDAQGVALVAREAGELNLALRTKVDFKLMEDE